VYTAKSNCSFHSFENKAKRQSSLFRFLEEPDLTVRRSHSHGNKRGLYGNIKNRSFPEQNRCSTPAHSAHMKTSPDFDPLTTAPSFAAKCGRTAELEHLWPS
jgi:hypothetical protein